MELGSAAFDRGRRRLGDRGDHRLRRLEVTARFLKIAQSLRAETFPLDGSADHDESCIAWGDDDILVVAFLRLFGRRFLGQPVAPDQKQARLRPLGVSAGDEIEILS